MKPDKARTQNFTVAVSFGCEREAAFEHAETKTVVSMPQPNGTIYTFGRDVNIIWRHGILQVSALTMGTQADITRNISRKISGHFQGLQGSAPSVTRW